MELAFDSGRLRRDFSKIDRVIDIPNLIDIQNRSFDRFLQADVDPQKRENIGLQAVFNSVFPIRDFNETASLEFVSYTLEKPKYDVLECLQRGMTYAAPIKVTVRLIVWEVAGERATRSRTGAQPTIRDVKEQEVYFGEIPVMTENGTFIINGTERAIVSQLHRSPGIFFDTGQATAVSAAGTTEKSVTIKRDANGPVIAFAGNAGTYSVDQTVSITCSATDAMSGIASSSCPSASGEAYSFAIGANSLAATASDQAGNQSSATASFTVAVTTDGLCALTTRWACGRMSTSRAPRCWAAEARSGE